MNFDNEDSLFHLWMKRRILMVKLFFWTMVSYFWGTVIKLLLLVRYLILGSKK